MDFHIDSHFPGGNIIVERIEGNTIFLRQDWESSSEWWFYWHFRVRGAQGKTLRFQFTDGDVFSACGPCVNRDGNWQWLGREIVESNAFLFTFGPRENEVAFAFCPSYLESDLESFLAAHPAVQRKVLCLSEEQRPIERLYFPTPDSEKFVLFTARTHACETMANFVLEGIIEAWENESSLHTAFDMHAVPFMDKDGAENGDQGKNRSPHDHNRDFTEAPLYASTRALMEQAPTWGECVFYLDLHCPWIRGGRNEELFFLGLPRHQEDLQRFMEILQATQRGPLHFDARHTIMPGEEWYQADAPTASRWGREKLVPKIATTLEVPYAMAGGEVMTPQKAYLFGVDLCRALAIYLQS